MVATVCVVAVGMGGFKAYNAANQSEADMLLAENVEALSQGEGYVPNGTINKHNPSDTKTCYKSYVDISNPRTERDVDSRGKVIEYKVYKHSYHSYTVKGCKSYSVKSKTYMDWWEDCITPKDAECEPGDYDHRPVPFEWWS